MARRRIALAAVGIIILAAILTSVLEADDGRRLSWVESHPENTASNIITRGQLAITADGAWVVACREREQSVLLFKRDFDSGRVHRCGQYDLTQWSVRPRCIAIAPGTKRCFVGCVDGSLFSLDIDESDSTLRGPSPLQWPTYLRTRRFPLSEIVGLAPFDGGRRVGAIDLSNGSIGLFEFDGWFGNERTAKVFQDRKFGELGVGKALAFATRIDGTLTATGLAITPRGSLAIVSSRQLNSVTVFQLDGESMGLKRSAGTAFDEAKNVGCRALASPRAVAISPDSKHVYVVGGSSNLAWLAIPDLAVAPTLRPSQ